MPRIILKNFRILDETTDVFGSAVLEDGLIRDILPGPAGPSSGGLVIDGSLWAPDGDLVLMPALVDLHAHFRDPGFPDKETLESAALAAVAGGYGTVVCMANTSPVIDTPEKAAALKERADRLGLIDLYPVISLTRGMEGRELSGITALPSPRYTPRLLSEDGKDVEDDGLFLEALSHARRLGLPVSCHCDAGGPPAAAAKKAGKSRAVWSRLEENHAVRRAIDLGMKAGAWIHIAHVSTAEAVELIRQTKAAGATPPFTLTCEATPHHLALTEETARALGEESRGRVNPPLRTEADRQALAAGLLDGTIDAIATDHAPHTPEDKLAGAPGFSSLDLGPWGIGGPGGPFSGAFMSSAEPTSGGSCLAAGGSKARLPQTGTSMLQRISRWVSGAPARILGLGGEAPSDGGAAAPPFTPVSLQRSPSRGRIAAGFRADLVLVRIGAAWTVDSRRFRSRGKNTPFEGRTLSGQILLTIHEGRIVYQAPDAGSEQ
ncbi:MAG: dihydroorotase [Spirochaetaceae bacterium]|jgi:dihydroorotase|nr:dihydroorotase [Spirochaetaceae bacterium]